MIDSKQPVWLKYFFVIATTVTSAFIIGTFVFFLRVYQDLPMLQNDLQVIKRSSKECIKKYHVEPELKDVKEMFKDVNDRFIENDIREIDIRDLRINTTRGGGSSVITPYITCPWNVFLVFPNHNDYCKNRNIL